MRLLTVVRSSPAQLNWPLSRWPSQKEGAFATRTGMLSAQLQTSGKTDGLCLLHGMVTSKYNQFFLHFYMNLVMGSGMRTLIPGYIYWCPNMCSVEITKVNTDIKPYQKICVQFYIPILFLMFLQSGLLLLWHRLNYVFAYYFHFCIVFLLQAICPFYVLALFY